MCSCACEGQRSTLVSSLLALHILFFRQNLSLNLELDDSSRLADQQGLVAPLSSPAPSQAPGLFMVQCLTLQAEPIMESLGWEKRGEFVRPISSVYVKSDTLAHYCSFKRQWRLCPCTALLHPIQLPKNHLFYSSVSLPWAAQQLILVSFSAPWLAKSLLSMLCAFNTINSYVKPYP